MFNFGIIRTTPTITGWYSIRLSNGLRGWYLNGMWTPNSLNGRAHQ